jgi:hypothetical protein
VKIPFAEQGDPDSLPVLFLHGYTDSWRSFEGVLPLLPRSVRAIAISQRGHGDADRPMTGYRASDPCLRSGIPHGYAWGRIRRHCRTLDGQLHRSTLRHRQSAPHARTGLGRILFDGQGQCRDRGAEGRRLGSRRSDRSGFRPQFPGEHDVAEVRSPSPNSRP